MRVIVLVCLALIVSPICAHSEESILSLLTSLRQEKEKLSDSLNSIENELANMKNKSLEMQKELDDWSVELERRRDQLKELQAELIRQEAQLIESERLRISLNESFDNYKTEAEGIIRGQETFLIVGGIAAGVVIVGLTIALIVK